MRAIVYSRVSTDAQERDGTSLETQERAGVEFVQAAGWSLLECVRDTASGYSLDRPGLERVRRLVRSGGVDVLVSYAVDRLSRNQIKLAVLVDEVEQADAHLEFVTETLEDSPIGRLMLSVRAFAAEVEREKIAERTTRGKLERARSGRIPQAIGRGTYGYTYNPKTGQREIEPFQAEVVRRIFQRYAETRSFTTVSNELNRDGILSHRGERWYPRTIRNMLRNESYAGRLIFRRTKWVAQRNGKTGARRRRPVDRPVEEWVEIPGASPRLVEEAIWQRVKGIIEDPERTAQRPTPRFYALRGRTKCAACGGAVTGQTLRMKGHEYRYYQCRHAYDKQVKQRCAAKFYIRADDLERAVWSEVRRVLSDPTVVLNELEQRHIAEIDPEEVARLEREIDSLLNREKRLVRLYTFGEIDDATIKEEGGSLRRQRDVLQDRLRTLTARQEPAVGRIDRQLLERACLVVADWLERANDQQRIMALEALQVAVTTAKGMATVSGVLPIDAPEFSAEERASRCTLPGK